jgi:VanZ family protein
MLKLTQLLLDSNKNIMSNNQPTRLKESQISKFIPGIAWFFLVLVLVCIPGYDLPKVDNWLIEINFDKFIHVGLFAVLAYLFILPLTKTTLSAKEKWHYGIKIAIATAVWGLTTELIQKFFIPGRSFNLTDWAADGFGGLIALLYCKKRLLK